MTFVKSRKTTNILLLLLVIIAIVFLVFHFGAKIKNHGSSEAKFTVGHHATPLLAFLYQASERQSQSREFVLTRFGSSSDVGYALLSGSIHAGFIEPSRILELRRLSGFEKLEVAGSVTFPYGATLVVRKGLNIRLGDMPSHRLAVIPHDTKLLNGFISDVKRFDIDLKPSDFITLSPEAIIPALEAGSIDAALIKGSHAIAAQFAGHSILYQLWEVQPGDDCCPAIIDQLEFLLLVQKEWPQKEKFLADLVAASDEGYDQQRKALASQMRIPASLAVEFPLTTFNLANDSLLILAGQHSGNEHAHAKASFIITDIHEQEPLEHSHVCEDEH
jgi:ABC-type nitrate/sulfonate/bicarbonate transport system substrate-binding protein